jgi:hypothetical protein
MRPDPATLGRIAHHQIVQPRMGDERKILEQCLRLGQMMIHALHQHRPFGSAQRFEIFRLERRLSQAEFAALLCYQACLHVFSASQSHQLLRIEQPFEGRKRPADQQRLLLPIVAQKFINGQSAKQGWDSIHAA